MEGGSEAHRGTVSLVPPPCHACGALKGATAFFRAPSSIAGVFSARQCVVLGKGHDIDRFRRIRLAA